MVIKAHGLIVAVGIIASLVILGGCQQRTRITSPLPMNYAAGDAEAEMAFWHGLADRPAVNNNEAFHALIAFHRSQGDEAKSYQKRVQYLKDQGFLAESFDRPAKATVRRGTVAQVLAPMLEIEGGVTMRLVGNHPRYALRALVEKDIMPESSVQQGLTGIQFVGIIDRARQYAERQQ